MGAQPTNDRIADVLERIASLLEAQDSNPFRIRAYREGAATVRSLKEPAAKLVKKDGLDELTDLPHIGDGIAAVIGEYVSSGKSGLLDDLEAQNSPEDVFARVPGLGKELAQRIVKTLHIQTLPELEDAAHDGRLESVEGFGARRSEAVRTALSAMLSRSQTSRRTNGNGKGNSKNGHSNGNESSSATVRSVDSAAKSDDKSASPDIALLLAVDEDYRKQAASGELKKIAPRRFNPENKAWLPVMHVKRDGWNFTVMFSNTAQAHQLEKTDDWVVMYFERDGSEHQHTVVTETKGTLKGRRVVRGRESEARKYYQAGKK